ncbi:hypothetical protein ES703_117160 [subsurface metagenome]
MKAVLLAQEFPAPEHLSFIQIHGQECAVASAEKGQIVVDYREDSYFLKSPGGDYGVESSLFINFQHKSFQIDNKDYVLK